MPKPSKVLRWCELTVVLVVFLWTMVGTARFAWVSGGTLEGLLGAIDRNWKGVLILSSLLFYRTLHEVLARVKKVRVGGVDFADEELPMTGNAELIEK